MSRQLEQVIEERSRKRGLLIVMAIEYGLAEAVQRAGGQPTGIAVKGILGDCLIVVKATFPGGPQVAFVGAEDFGSALIKCVRLAAADKLLWRADKYGG